MDEVLGDHLRGAVAVDYVTEVDELLALVQRGGPAVDAVVPAEDCCAWSTPARGWHL